MTLTGQWRSRSVAEQGALINCPLREKCSGQRGAAHVCGFGARQASFNRALGVVGANITACRLRHLLPLSRMHRSTEKVPPKSSKVGQDALLFLRALI